MNDKKEITSDTNLDLDDNTLSNNIDNSNNIAHSSKDDVGLTLLSEPTEYVLQNAIININNEQLDNALDEATRTDKNLFDEYAGDAEKIILPDDGQPVRFFVDEASLIDLSGFANQIRSMKIFGNNYVLELDSGQIVALENFVNASISSIPPVLITAEDVIMFGDIFIESLHNYAQLGDTNSYISNDDDSAEKRAFNAFMDGNLDALGLNDVAGSTNAPDSNLYNDPSDITTPRQQQSILEEQAKSLIKLTQDNTQEYVRESFNFNEFTIKDDAPILITPNPVLQDSEDDKNIPALQGSNYSTIKEGTILAPNIAESYLRGNIDDQNSLKNAGLSEHVIDYALDQNIDIVTGSSSNLPGLLGDGPNILATKFVEAALPANNISNIADATVIDPYPNIDILPPPPKILKFIGSALSFEAFDPLQEQVPRTTNFIVDADANSKTNILTFGANTSILVADGTSSITETEGTFVKNIAFGDYGVSFTETLISSDDNELLNNLKNVTIEDQVVTLDAIIQLNYEYDNLETRNFILTLSNIPDGIAVDYNNQTHEQTNNTVILNVNSELIPEIRLHGIPNGSDGFSIDAMLSSNEEGVPTSTAIISIEPSLGATDSDTITGSNQDDVIFGQKGDDTINGGVGNDTLYGGEGNDVLYGNNGNNYINAGLGNDYIKLTDGSGGNIVIGGDGDDIIAIKNNNISTTINNNIIIGGDGQDRVLYQLSLDNFFNRIDASLTDNLDPLRAYELLQLQNFLAGIDEHPATKDQNGNVVFDTLGLHFLVQEDGNLDIEEFFVKAPTVIGTTESSGVFSGKAGFNPFSDFVSDNNPSSNIKHIIADIPSFYSLSNGVLHDGVWTITADDLDGLSLNYNGTTRPSNDVFNVTAITVDDTELIAEHIVAAFPINLPNITFAESFTDTLEDTTFPLQLNVSTDNPVIDVISKVVIGNVPSGLQFNIASAPHDGLGSYTFTKAEANNLIITLPAHSDSDHDLLITAFAEDNATGQAISVNIVPYHIEVAAVADPSNPIIILESNIQEDVAFSLSIEANIIDLDGSESLYFIIETPNNDFTLSQGLSLNNVLWTLNKEQLSNLTIAPPIDTHGTFTLTVSSITVESNDNATRVDLVSQEFYINPVADTGTLSISNTTAVEDGVFDLNINYASTDRVASESVKFILEGLNTSANLNNFAEFNDGLFTLSPVDLHRLSVTPDENIAGTFTLTLSAISYEEDDPSSTAILTTEHIIFIEYAADTPIVMLSDVSGTEDEIINLNLRNTITPGEDDGSETISKIIISNVESGFTISNATFLGTGQWQLLDLDNLDFIEIIQPANARNDQFLTYSIFSSEVAQPDTEIIVTALQKVTIHAIADPIIGTINPLDTREDTGVLFSFSLSLTDSDGSEQISNIIINAPPSGSYVVTPSGTLIVTDGIITIPFDVFAKTTFVPPPNSDDEFILDISVISQEAIQVERDGTTGDIRYFFNITDPGINDGIFVDSIIREDLRTTVSTFSVPVNVRAVADVPLLTSRTIIADEDTPTKIDLAPGFADRDGSETISVIIQGVPIGASFNHGEFRGLVDGLGAWQIQADDLLDLYFTPPTDVGEFTPVINTPEFELTVIAVTQETNFDGVPVASNSVIVPVYVNPIADGGTINNTGTIIINEDSSSSTDLSIDLQDPSEGILNLLLSNIPSGFVINGLSPNAAGRINLLGSGVIDRLQITPPSNLGDFAHTFLYTIQTIELDQNGNLLAGITGNNVVEVPIYINAITDGVSLAVVGVGREDTESTLQFNIDYLDDDDSEELIYVVIAGFPSGLELRNSLNINPGTVVDGLWTIDIAQDNTLIFTPFPHSSDDYNLTVTSFSNEKSDPDNPITQIQHLTYPITAVIDSISINVNNVSGIEDSSFQLAMNIDFVDNDGSETVSYILVSDVLSGSGFTAGERLTSSEWKFTSIEQLNNANYIPPSNLSGENFNFSYTVYHTDQDLGSTVFTTYVSSFNLNPVADTPQFVGDVTSALEDVDIILNLVIGNDDDSNITINNGGRSIIDGAELFDKVIINGIPSGFILRNGLGTAQVPIDGSVNINNVNNAGALSGITLVLDPGFEDRQHLNDSFQVTLTAISSDDSDATNPFQTAIASHTIDVVVNAVADPVELMFATQQTNEDVVVGLNVPFSLIDNDGSEFVDNVIIRPVFDSSYTDEEINNYNNTRINGLLSAGGRWEFSGTTLASLLVTPSLNSETDLTFDVTLVSRELSNANTFLTNQIIILEVDAIADPITLNSPSDIAISEDSDGNSILIRTNFTDTDGSESLIYVISNVPFGGLFQNNDTYDGSIPIISGDGTSFTFVPQVTDNAFASLDIKFIPPADLAGSFMLSLSAINSEAEGDSRFVLKQTLNLSIIGIADPPTVTAIADISVNEDVEIDIPLNADIADADNSESVSLVMLGLPPLATLSTGNNLTGGVFQLTQEQLIANPTITITPPSNYNGDFTVTYSFVTTEKLAPFHQASTVLTNIITVEPLTDTANLSASDAATQEDIAIEIEIDAFPVNPVEESVLIIISNIPSNASFSSGIPNLVGGDITYTLTLSNLPGLLYTPPPNVAGSATLKVTALATDASDSVAAGTAINVVDLIINTDAINDDVDLVRTEYSGIEDTIVPLSISFNYADMDESETINSITLRNASAHGFNKGTFFGNDLILTFADLEDLMLTPATNFSGRINFPIIFEVVDISDINTDSKSFSDNIIINIAPVADDAVINTSTLALTEDVAGFLNTAAVLSDTSEVIENVIIEGVEGTIDLTRILGFDGVLYTVNAAELAAIKITPVADSDVDFTITYSVTTVEPATLTSRITTANQIVTISEALDNVSLSVPAIIIPENKEQDIELSFAFNDDDDSESLLLIVSSPITVTLTQGGIIGTILPGGSFTIDNDLIDDPARNYSLNILGLQEDFRLTYTAISSENSPITSVTEPSPVQQIFFQEINVVPFVGTPEITVLPRTADEDDAIPLRVNATLADPAQADRETLTLFINNVPTGAQLNFGTHDSSGRWTITQDMFEVFGEGTAMTHARFLDNIANNLELQPAEHSDQDFILSYTLFANENDASSPGQSSVATQNIIVNAIIDEPEFSATALNIVEGQETSLFINVSLIDDSESIRDIYITTHRGKLTQGIDDGNGNYTLSTEQLGSLFYLSDPNSDDDYILTVSFLIEEKNSGALGIKTNIVPINISAIVDAPSFILNDQVGVEDNPIALNITLALNDDDTYTDNTGTVITPVNNSETIEAFILSSVPSGAKFYDGLTLLSPTGSSGTFTIPIMNVPNLGLLPPEHDSRPINLQGTAIVKELNEGTTFLSVRTFQILVDPVADTPSFSLQTSISTNEDEAVAINFDMSRVDIDSSYTTDESLRSETLRAIISNLPTGTMLNNGVYNPDSNLWTVERDSFAGLMLTPPTDVFGEFTLQITALTEERNTIPAITALNVQSTILNIVSGIDTPFLTANVSTGDENTSILLDIDIMQAATNDRETLNILIEGVPLGASLSSGSLLPSGLWRVNDISGLAFIPAANDDTNYNLSLTAISNLIGDPTNSVLTSAALSLVVLPVAQTPSLDISTGINEHFFPISISFSVIDTDGSESIYFILPALPTSALRYNTGIIDTTTNTTKITRDTISGLGIEVLSQVDDTFNLDITAISIDRGISTAMNVVNVNFPVINVADTPNLIVADATGDEDDLFTLTVQTSLQFLSDSDVESIQLIINNVPTGADINIPTSDGRTITDRAYTFDISGSAFGDQILYTPTLHDSSTVQLTVTALTEEGGTTALISVVNTITLNPLNDLASFTISSTNINEDITTPFLINIGPSDNDGSEILNDIIINGLPTGATLNNGTAIGTNGWKLLPAELTGLEFTPPSDDFNRDDITLLYTVTTQEAALSVAQTSFASQIISINAVADSIVVTFNNATTNEDVIVALSIKVTDFDVFGSETQFVIIDVPSGTLNNGVANDTLWTLQVSDLTNLKYTPIAESDDDVIITVTAITKETSNDDIQSQIISQTVTINAIADTANIVVTPHDTSEDLSVALEIHVTLDDDDENTKIIIAVPSGASLSDGMFSTPTPTLWTLSLEQLSTLTFTPQSNATNGNITISVITEEPSNGFTAITSITHDISISPVIDIPILERPQNVILDEDSGVVHLNFQRSIIDDDGSESFRFVIAGVATGAEITDNTGTVINARAVDGNYTFGNIDYNSLYYSPETNESGTTRLTTTLIATETGLADSITNVFVSNTNVIVNPVADTPMLSVSDLTHTEGATINATSFLTPNLTGNPSSETITFVFSDLPSGSSFSRGTNNGFDGKWFVSAQNLTSLLFQPSPDRGDDFTFAVSLLTTEGTSQASTIRNVAVTVSPLADTASLVTPTFNINEDTLTPIDLTLLFNDMDGSESMEVIISNVPSTATISSTAASIIFTKNLIDNSIYTISNINSSDYVGLPTLKLLTPTDNDDDFTIIITATTFENSTNTAITSAELPIVVNPVIDSITLTATDLATKEDISIPLNATAALTDTDGSESLSFIVRLSNGATLNVGTLDAIVDGKYNNITVTDLASAVIIPEAENGDDIVVDITAIATESDDSTQRIARSASISVDVTPVSDTATTTFSTTSMRTINDDFALSIQISFVDEDRSEFQSITISGLSGDFSLTENVSSPPATVAIDAGGVSDRLTEEQFNNLTVKYNGSAGDVTLTVTAIAAEFTAGIDAASNVISQVIAFSPSVVLPIGIDLDGDGVEIVTLDDSSATFDVDNDGVLEKVAWVGADDGFIITDLDGDGTLSSSDELLIANQTTADDTDLEALRTLYDSNKDGVVNAQDDKFDSILIFQDKNQNGQADDGEVISLGDANIEEISVISDEQRTILSDGTTIYGQTTYTKTNGEQAAIADLGLAFNELPMTVPLSTHEDLNFVPIFSDESLMLSFSSTVTSHDTELIQIAHATITTNDNHDSSIEYGYNDGDKLLVKNDVIFMDYSNARTLSLYSDASFSMALSLTSINKNSLQDINHLNSTILQNLPSNNYIVTSINNNATIHHELPNFVEYLEQHGHNSSLKYTIVDLNNINALEYKIDVENNDIRHSNYRNRVIDSANEPLSDIIMDDYISTKQYQDENQESLWLDQGDYSLDNTGFFDLPLGRDTVFEDEFRLDFSNRQDFMYDYELLDDPATFDDMQPIIGQHNDNTDNSAIEEFDLDDDNDIIFDNTTSIWDINDGKLQINGYDSHDLFVEIIGNDALLRFNDNENGVLLKNAALNNNSITIDDIIDKHITLFMDDTPTSSQKKSTASPPEHQVASNNVLINDVTSLDDDIPPELE